MPTEFSTLKFYSKQRAETREDITELANDMVYFDL